MPRAATVVLQPRKTPVQARSQASVTAILDAALQVLVAVGRDRLTTSRVAVRAGVSVGTLYQYFPNKHALLRAVLRRHMDEVGSAIESCCEEQRGQGVEQMGAALISAYLRVKLRRVRESAALYAVASDADGAAIREEASARTIRAVAGMFATAQERLIETPELLAMSVTAAVNGVARRILEDRAHRAAAADLEHGLSRMVSAYLQACCRSQTRACYQAIFAGKNSANRSS